MTKTKAKNRRKQPRECWLFLDCQGMTGHPPSECPNFMDCRRQALASPNRVCKLPYLVQHFNPVSYPDFKVELCVLRVLLNCSSEESLAAGWLPAEPLFYTRNEMPYSFSYGKVVYGKTLSLTIAYEEMMGTPPVSHHVPPEAKRLGFAEAVKLPYRFDPAGCLRVLFDPSVPSNAEAIAAGWYPAEYSFLFFDGEQRKELNSETNRLLWDEDFLVEQMEIFLSKGYSASEFLVYLQSQPTPGDWLF